MEPFYPPERTDLIMPVPCVNRDWKDESGRQWEKCTEKDKPRPG